MKIRPAAALDAGEIASVHVQSWQEAYRGIVPDDYLKSLSVANRARSWTEIISGDDPEVWVAEDPYIIGFAAFGPSRDEDAAPTTGEIQAIYVAPGQWSTGAGRALWLAARGRLRERGFSSVTLWVLSRNERAIRFYRAAGFRPDPGTEKEISIGGRPLREIRYELTFGEDLGE